MTFIDYKGGCKYDHIKNLYRFTMKNEILEEEYYTEISDPTVDNTFKQIFLGDKKITESCLNSLLFPGEDRINDINFLPTENPGNGPYSAGSIRMDVLCECNLEKTEDIDQHYNNDLDLIIDLEIEKGFKNTNDERFIKYARTLSGKYIDKKILILALIITPNIIYSYKNKGSEIHFQKESYDNYKNVMLYEDVSIYQIDLNFLLKLLKDKKKIDILNGNYLNNKGKEWIKFITVSSWCDSINDGYYILPPLGKTFCEDEQILKAIKILESKNLAYMKSKIDQDILLKEIIENKEIKKENEEIKKKYEKSEREKNIWKEKYEKLLKEKRDEPMDIISEDKDDLPKKNKKKKKVMYPKDQ